MAFTANALDVREVQFNAKLSEAGVDDIYFVVRQRVGAAAELRNNSVDNAVHFHAGKLNFYPKATHRTRVGMQLQGQWPKLLTIGC